MIDLYKHENKNYENNGDITLTPISCILKQVLNGENYIEMVHPFDKQGRWQYLLYDNVITVPTPTSKKQLYRIYNHVKNDDSVTVYARHIFFDLVDKVLLGIRPSLVNGQTCLDMILKDTDFKGHSNIATNNVILDLDGKNIINSICGNEQSFIKEYGGEILLDNFNITINNKIGTDNGIQALFGFNLESIEEDINIEEVHTRLIPEMGDGTRLKGNNPWVDSKYINKYANIKETIVKFDDIKIKENQEDEEGFTTRQEAETEMIRRCNVLLNNCVDLPIVNYKINIADLSNTNDYKKYKQLLKVNLGDTVTCKHRMLDIDVKARCISFTFDCLTEKYDEIELGQFVSNYLDMQNEINSDLRKKIELTEQKIKLEVSNVSKTLNSKIEMTEKSINSSVENKIAGVNSTITQTANRINERVDNVKEGLSSEIELVDDKISAVVQKGDKSGSWELDTDAFKVAFSGSTSDKVQIDRHGIIAEDSNGGYTRMGSKGLLHVSSKSSTSGKPYHYLTFTKDDIDISCSSDDYEDKYVDLPKEFWELDKEDIAVSVSIQKIWKKGSYIPYWSGAYCYPTRDCKQIRIQGLSTWKKYDDLGGETYGGHITVSVTAIA
ncbi:endopeptidase [Clostridium botulinum]|nr:endopeptidase [Clostridium botulinum]NFH88837.1 endopeptidase [Clostridium botulinum]NFI16791.1 endopeptidase [Clostridium botulinum]NFL93289.1 endopeptidase [Clostridium botulinum]NFN50287.1 endopeptidase [Clostridium botulinum]